MNSSLKKVIWMMLGGIVVVTTIFALIQSRRGSDARLALANTRRALREQGFRTELADFSVTTDGATRTRMAALTFLNDWLDFGPHGDQLDLLPALSDDTADVIWKQEQLNIGVGGLLQWSDLHAVLDTNRELLDAACDAALSGPIRFDVDVSSSRLIERHSSLRRLSTALSSRAILELHDGSRNAAWTNLLAATRLVTAWGREPAGISHLMRCAMVHATFAGTWQIIQSENLADEKLAALQQEWESASFFTNLTETVALDRASGADICRRLSQQPPFPRFSFRGFVKKVFQQPSRAYSDIMDGVGIIRYRGNAALRDEESLLLYFRDRELEMRKAIRAPTWIEMRALPGVTNVVSFKSGSHELMGFTRSYQVTENLLLGFAADGEARRRILVTALALERYRGKHGAYPARLATLAPEFLKMVPLDFMDGQPLRYRLTGDGHFVLYSIGLDCVDDGGKLPRPDAPRMLKDSSGFFIAPTNMDIVWPRPDAGSVRAPRR